MGWHGAGGKDGWCHLCDWRTRTPSETQESWIVDMHLVLLSITVYTETMPYCLVTHVVGEKKAILAIPQKPHWADVTYVTISGWQESRQVLILTGVLYAAASEPSTTALVLDLQNQISKVLFLCIRLEPQEHSQH